MTSTLPNTHFSQYRRLIDKHLPMLGRAYRHLRDAAVNRKIRPTAYDFTLAGDEVFTRPEFERLETALFLELLETHDVVLDIGANIGFYSCLAASKGKPVVAIEPHPRNIRYLLSNISRNNFKVDVLPIALGSESGVMEMFGFGGMASLVRGWGQLRESHGVLVPVSTLARVAGIIPSQQRILIKIDVEGSEYDVLSGAENVLSLDPQPTWLVEILCGGVFVPGGRNARLRETFEVFWQHGYECHHVTDLLPIVTRDQVESWSVHSNPSALPRNFLFRAAGQASVALGAVAVADVQAGVVTNITL